MAGWRKAGTGCSNSVSDLAGSWTDTGNPQMKRNRVSDKPGGGRHTCRYYNGDRIWSPVVENPVLIRKAGIKNLFSLNQEIESGVKCCRKW